MPQHLYNRDDLVDVTAALAARIAAEENKPEDSYDEIADRIVARHVEDNRVSLVLSIEEAHEAMAEAIAHERRYKGRVVGERVQT